MAIRGLIIAIEKYAKIQGFGSELPGTTAAGVAFRKWLLETKQAAPENILFCTPDETAEGRTAGATMDDLIDALVTLHTQGKDATEQLYFFFSGHGFLFEEDLRRRAADVLLAANFTSANDPAAGRRGLKLDEVQTKLQMGMGSGDHFYFIDACRNKVKEIDVPGTGLNLGRSVLGDPTVYTLYSTNRGSAAFVTSHFSQHLLDGLRGSGHAKVWRPTGDMEVTHSSLREYVKEKLAGQETDARVDGDGHGLILEIRQVPQYECTVEVAGAKARDEFTWSLFDARGRPIGGAQSFHGPKFRFSQTPDYYRLRLSYDGRPLEPAEQTLDLWDACAVRFSMPTRGGIVPEAFPAPPMGAPEEGFLGGPPEPPPPPSPGPVRAAILSALPSEAKDGGKVAFSESLGWIEDDDLGLWLALLGASRIVRDPGTFSKLQSFPLARFDDVAAGGSAVYVLAGRDDLEGLRVAVGTARAADWTETTEVMAGVTGLRHLRLDHPPGPLFLSLAVAGDSPQTFVSHCLPNRATLVVATGSTTRGGLRIQQSLLPLAHLNDELPPIVRQHLPPNRLEAVKFLSLAQRQFARKREIEPTANQGGWADLLYGKWLDPVIALLTAYELIRRGRREHIKEVIGNLRSYFPGLPDTEALAKLAGLPFTRPASVPLVLDGLLAFEDYAALLPETLPEDRLDYAGPWTAWRRAVR